jgi:stage V sporulation protein G
MANILKENKKDITYLEINSYHGHDSFLIEYEKVKNIISQKELRKRGTNMQITDVRVRKVTKEGKMRAVVSITIDDVFVVHDIKVIEGEKGLFIAMPSRKASDGEYRDIAHPINSETRDKIQSLILEKYQEVASESEDEE